MDGSAAMEEAAAAAADLRSRELELWEQVILRQNWDGESCGVVLLDTLVHVTTAVTPV